MSINISKKKVSLISNSSAAVTADFPVFTGYIDEIIIAPHSANVSSNVSVVAIKASDMPSTVDDVTLLTAYGVSSTTVKRPRYTVHNSAGTVITDDFQMYPVSGETIRASLLTSNNSGETFSVQLKYSNRK